MHSLYGGFRQVKFTSVPTNDHATSLKEWDRADNFLADWKETFYYTNNHTATADWVSDNNIKLIYNLLYAEYGNSVVGSSDINRFKHKVFTIIWEAAPTYLKRLEIQKKLCAMGDDDIVEGAESQYDTSLNPQTTPDPNIDGYINQRNVNKYKKSRLEGYAILWEELKNDTTKIFVGKFKNLFLSVVSPELPLYYETETEVES